MKITARKAKDLLTQEKALEWIVNFSKVRKGSVLTYIPSQAINPTDILKYGLPQERIKMYKLVVTELDADSIVGQVLTENYASFRVKFDRSSGQELTKDHTCGQVINRKFQPNYIFIFGALSDWLRYSIHKAIFVIVGSEAGRQRREAEDKAKEAVTARSEPYKRRYNWLP
jgi:hypothetical protein